MESSSVESIVQALRDGKLQSWEELPEIELYMDQVVTYLKRQLSMFVDNSTGNLITPSIINNYVKAGVTPRPVKKKYGKEQLSALLMACLLKGVMPASSIKTLVMRDGHAPDEQYHAGFINQLRDVFSTEADLLEELNRAGGLEREELFELALCFAMRANADRYITDQLLYIINGQEQD